MPDHTVLRTTAKELNYTSPLPIDEFLAIYAALRQADPDRHKTRQKIPQEAGRLIALALLTGHPLSSASFICVSDYVGGTRYNLQQGSYALTGGEQRLFKQMTLLRKSLAENRVTLNWRLILADGWGLELYRERVVPGAIDQYCAVMAEHCRGYGFTSHRWSELMEKHVAAYQTAANNVEPIAAQLAPWEAQKGEIAHDRPAPEAKLALATRHIQMRAAEAVGMVAEFGPTLVLSTESQGLTRYDNLVVAKKDYPILHTAPFYPHRL